MKSSEFDYVTTFPPLGHPEHHFNKYPNHPWLKNKSDILRWLYYSDDESKSSDFYIINDDMTVTVRDKKGFVRKPDVENYIPVQFREVEYFYYSNINLYSAIGSPYIVNNLFLNSNKGLNSFEGISKNVRHKISLNDTGIEDFSKMQNYTSNFVEISLVGCNIKSWDGFTNCNRLCWSQDEWCDKRSYELLISTPESIKEIKISKAFAEKCKVFFNTISQIINEEINMEDLRVRQKIIKKTKNTEIKIEDALKVKVTSKKRKL